MLHLLSMCHGQHSDRAREVGGLPLLTHAVHRRRQHLGRPLRPSARCPCAGAWTASSQLHSRDASMILARISCLQRCFRGRWRGSVEAHRGLCLRFPGPAAAPQAHANRPSSSSSSSSRGRTQAAPGRTHNRACGNRRCPAPVVRGTGLPRVPLTGASRSRRLHPPRGSHRRGHRQGARLCGRIFHRAGSMRRLLFRRRRPGCPLSPLPARGDVLLPPVEALGGVQAALQAPPPREARPRRGQRQTPDVLTCLASRCYQKHPLGSTGPHCQRHLQLGSPR